MKVLITGARNGIGFNVGLYLYRKGYDVILTVHRNDELDKLKDKIKKMNVNILCLKLDITSEIDRNKIRDLDIDILINNASVGIGGSLINIDTKLVKKNFNVNVIGTLRLSQIYLSDLYLKKRKGKIIFISSLAGIRPINYLGTYALTKSSIIMLSKILKREVKLINLDCKIKLIEPGIYNTGFNDYMFSYVNNNKVLKYKKIFKLFGKNNLNSISKIIYKSLVSTSNKLIYRSKLDSFIVKIYNLLFS